MRLFETQRSYLRFVSRLNSSSWCLPCTAGPCRPRQRQAQGRIAPVQKSAEQSALSKPELLIVQGSCLVQVGQSGSGLRQALRLLAECSYRLAGGRRRGREHWARQRRARRRGLNALQKEARRALPAVPPIHDAICQRQRPGGLVPCAPGGAVELRCCESARPLLAATAANGAVGPRKPRALARALCAARASARTPLRARLCARASTRTRQRYARARSRHTLFFCVRRL